MLSSEPTLEELRIIRLAYLQQGASIFTDLALVTRRMGLPCQAPNILEKGYFSLGHTNCNLYDLGDISAVWREKKIAGSLSTELLHITIGKPVLRVREVPQPADALAGDQMVILREDVICRLKRLVAKSEEQSTTFPVGVDDDSKFIPGKWVGRILDQLEYARELTGSMHELNLERQRVDLLRELMIGRNI